LIELPARMIPDEAELLDPKTHLFRKFCAWLQQ